MKVTTPGRLTDSGYWNASVAGSAIVHFVLLWNEEGGVIHWTHHDPEGRHVAGWVKHNGKTFKLLTARSALRLRNPTRQEYDRQQREGAHSPQPAQSAPPECPHGRRAEGQDQRVLLRLFLSGAIMAALFSLLAVLILGKRRSDQTESNSHSRLNMTVGQWVGKLSLIVIGYLVIYFTFGYFIAWKSAAVRAYYGGSDPGTFSAQMSSVLRDTPLLLPLQAVRAILWTAIAVPVIRMMRGQWWETGLAVALLFAVVMNSQLLLPNPFMPQDVRMVHLLETATSNFLFGWLIVLVLLGWRQSASD